MLKKNIFVIIIIFVVTALLFPTAGCRKYDDRFDLSYFFKTEPEKATIDFLYAVRDHDAEYIYSNLLPDSDRRNISKEKFIRELDQIFSSVKEIQINQTVYLGLEESTGKVVVEFTATYANGQVSEYKKYFFLILENNLWKILFGKTFI